MNIFSLYYFKLINRVIFLVPLVAILLVSSPHQTVGQSLSGLNWTTLKVDELSDDQIQSILERARERGLSESDLLTAVKQRGLSDIEIAKFRERVLRLGMGSTTLSSPASSESVRSSSSLASDDIFGLTVNSSVRNLNELEQRIFGMGLFRSNGLNFAPNFNIPTPVDYELGPGDQINVDLWGTAQQFFSFPVSREGTIRPERLGPIYVNGLTIDQASKRIIDRLSEIYSGLKAKEGKAPTVFCQVSLGKIRTINVEVVGAVSQPGIYALPSLATVYTALHAAGGPTDNGTFRNIRLVRDNKLLTVIDIYTFLTQGIKSGDVRLKHRDVIVIPPYESRVELTGQVKTPGLFELKESETFEDMLNFANGFTDVAFKDGISVHRNGSSEMKILDVPSSEFKSFYPQSGDKIEVGKIFNRFSNRLVMKGAVFRPGEYQLEDGITLMEAIEKAGGLRPDAFTSRITIYRVGDDYSQEVLSIDLEAVLKGEFPDVPLSNEDIITISSRYDLEEEYYVSISGEVIEAGIYPYFRGMTVKDLVILAGGFKESASGAFIEIARRNKVEADNSVAEILSISINRDFSLSAEDEQFSVKPFDQVYIRISPGYSVQKQITVEGEVVAPGPYVISKKDERVSDIISRARGFTPYAYLEGAILIRQTEFDKSRSGELIDQSELQFLRNKILDGKSQLRGSELSELLVRIQKLKSRIEAVDEQDVQGSRLKQDLITGLEKRDSLVQNLEIQSQEPVALELTKIMENPGNKYDLIVKPGDILSIPAKLETVRVTGEVTTSLNIRYDENFSFKDYVNFSGGFLGSAMRGRSYVQYPNGESRGSKRFLFFKFYPKVVPGSTIIIAKKPERKPLNFQAIIGAVGSVATVVLLVDRLTN